LDAHNEYPALPSPIVEHIAQRFSLSWVDLLEKISDIRFGEERKENGYTEE
jgi:hypothetical protein